MNRVGCLVRKEFLHLRNDPVGLRLMVIPIVAMVFVFAYAITTEVRNTTVTVCDRSDTPLSRSLVESITGNQLFKFVGASRTEERVRELLDQGRARLGVIIAPDFTRRIGRGEQASVVVLVDGQDATSSQVSSGYVTAIIAGWARERGMLRLVAAGGCERDMLPIEVVPQVLFNPLLKSSWFMVPALAVLLVTMVTALLSGFSIVRERESGTLEQLLVTPINTLDLLLGKTIPYMAVGLVEFFLVLVLAGTWFGVPFRGAWSTLFVFALVYLFSSLGIGMFTSIVAKTPYQALFMTWFTLIVFILLSGFFMPLENMPVWVQYLARVNPVRYFILAVREITLKGAGMKDLWREAAAMAAIGTVLYGCALLAFKRRLA